MTEKQENGLSREEREAFRELAEMRYHSLGDEERIVGILRKRGLIRSRPQVFRWLFRGIAAAAVLFVTFFMGAQYGSRSTGGTEPVVKPMREDHSTPSRFTTTVTVTEDPTVLEDYRDEPDRPGMGGSLYAKTIE